MAVTAASLKANRPEFASVNDAIVTSFIAKAVRAHDETVWGDLVDDGVELHTCDALARSPYARNLRLVMDDNTSIYQMEWRRLKTQVGGAYRLLP